MRNIAWPVVTAVLCALGVVVGSFSGIAVPWSDLLRPLIVAVSAAIVIGAIAGLLLRPFAATAIAAVLTVFLISWLVGILVGLGLALALLLGRIRHNHVGNAVGVRPIIVAAACFAIASLATAIASHGLPHIIPSTSAASNRGGASTYLILLDGYPRGDTLREDFGYDNESFLRALEDRGFAVDRQRTGGVTATPIALAHLLGVNIADMDVDSMGMKDSLELSRRLSSAPIFTEWQHAGYRFLSIRTPIGYATLDGAIDTGQLTEFETILAADTPLAPWIGDWVLTQHRERLEASLRLLADLASGGSSKVVLAHLLAPHPPFLNRPMPPCWPSCTPWNSSGLSWSGDPATYAAAVREQVATLNPLVLDTLDAVITADPGAAIIVFSDHGFRHRPRGDPEWDRILYAIRGEPSVEIPGFGF